MGFSKFMRARWEEDFAFIDVEYILLQSPVNF